jgi:glycosyltransferase involved in cell wall biosynthesis
MVRRADPGFPIANGEFYLDVLARLHKSIQPNWYLEVGTQTGASLKLSSARSISIDPAYVLRNEVVGAKPELYIFQQTSDAFFQSGRMEALNTIVDFAFLDGMHLFEYLLRDFINTERYADNNTVVVLHDCLPWNANMAVRNRSECNTNEWTGDVWKIVPVLQKYRPDITIDILDAAPTGLVIVSGLDAKNTVLADNYDEIMDKYLTEDFDSYGASNYFDAISISSTGQSRWCADNCFFLASGWESNPEISIKIAAPNREVMENWGDYHFARSLSHAFGRLGYRANVVPQENWYDQTKPGGIDLVLRGKANFVRQSGRTSLFWAISKPLRTMNLNNADHVFYASKILYDAAVAEHGEENASLLPQAFDRNICKPRKNSSGNGMVFVGRNRATYNRSSVAYAANMAEPFALYGPGWSETKYAGYVKGESVDNKSIGKIYAEADIVLNDHTPVMKSQGFLSNRIFDTLACGAIPVTDGVGWLPECIADYVYTYEDFDGFEVAVIKAKNETKAKREKRLKFAKDIRNTHSMDARAQQILDVYSRVQARTDFQKADVDDATQ